MIKNYCCYRWSISIYGSKLAIRYVWVLTNINFKIQMSEGIFQQSCFLPIQHIQKQFTMKHVLVRFFSWKVLSFVNDAKFLCNVIESNNCTLIIFNMIIKYFLLHYSITEDCIAYLFTIFVFHIEDFLMPKKYQCLKNGDQGLPILIPKSWYCNFKNSWNTCHMFLLSEECYIIHYGTAKLARMNKHRRYMISAQEDCLNSLTI